MALRRDGILILSGYAFLKRHRHVAPYLDSQDDRGREQHRSHRDMYDRSHYHGQLRLRGVSPPYHPSDKGEEPEAELRDH